MRSPPLPYLPLASVLLVACGAAPPAAPAASSTSLTAGAAASSAAASSSALPVRELTAAGYIAPLTRLDRTEGACGYLQHTHVEGIDLRTGEVRWSAPEWSQALGELADGGVVVASGSAIGVLERATGAVRVRCQPPRAAQNVDWTFDPPGLHGESFVPQAPHGAMMPPRPQPPSMHVRAEISGTGCTVAEVEPSPVARRRPVPPTTWSNGAWTMTEAIVPAESPKAESKLARIGTHEGVQKWQRVLGPVLPSQPCLLP